MNFEYINLGYNCIISSKVLFPDLRLAIRISAQVRIKIIRLMRMINAGGALGMAKQGLMWECD